MNRVGIRQIGSNQTELHLPKVIVLFSYETPVAYLRRDNGRYYVTSDKFSTTTSKHINRWVPDIKRTIAVTQDNVFTACEVGAA